jgi:hypothetical protein
MIYLFLDHRVFWDLALEWRSQLRQKGFPVEIINSIPDEMADQLVVMFGLNHYAGQMPRAYIAVQLEQSPQSDWFTKRYRELLEGAWAVWDYSLVNFRRLRQHNHRYRCLTLGCGSSWLDPSIEPREPEYDVLFMGQINDRRRSILDQLKSRGARCLVLENSWGLDRLRAIRNSRLVVNIHYYDEAVLEAVRLSYVLSTGALTVSEASCDQVLDHHYSKYLTITSYGELVETVLQLLADPDRQERLREKAVAFLSTATRLPIEDLEANEQLVVSKPIQSVTPIDGYDQLDELIVNSQDIQEVKQEIKDGSLIVKVKQFEDDQLPPVSIVTVTRNRKHLFDMPIRNFTRFEYPSDRLEWVIVDDSDLPDQNLIDLLPNDSRIKYLRVVRKNRHQMNQKRKKSNDDRLVQRETVFLNRGENLPLDIGRKRNLGVRHASHDFICMMDDDDYYYPLSIYSRIAIMLSYPEYSCVGVTDLDVYDIDRHSCARFQSPHLSEASMAFVRQFWIERPFPEQEHTLGEGYPFTRGRRHRLVKMPSCFNLIAITHGGNFTGRRRLIAEQKRSDLLKQLDLETKLFLFDWKGAAA